LKLTLAVANAACFTTLLVTTGCQGAEVATPPVSDASLQGTQFQIGSLPASKAQAIAAFTQPLPEPLIALGHGASRYITSPIIDDSGAYTDGPIIRATNTTTGYGLEGVTDVTGAGIYGHAASGNTNSYGVYGFSPGGAGVYGYDAQTGAGVLGSSMNGDGVEGISAGSQTYGGYFTNTGSGGALYAQAVGGTAVKAISSSGFPVIFASSNNSTSVSATTTGSKPAVYAVASGPLNSGGGAFEGTAYGLIARAPAGTASYPIVAQDLTAKNVFYVDGNGDVFAHGYNALKATSTRQKALGYAAAATTPAVEDTGSAQLVNGSATVRLDPTFAQMMDSTSTYHVALTPDGDTLGLYVAGKTGSAFVVREVQDGRDSLAFDYHVYGTAQGHARDRMGLASSAGPRPPARPR
jgi:hypothetical protein